LVSASAAKKLFSIFNVKRPVSSRSWTEHTSIVEKQAKQLLECELQDGSFCNLPFPLPLPLPLLPLPRLFPQGLLEAPSMEAIHAAK